MTTDETRPLSERAQRSIRDFSRQERELVVLAWMVSVAAVAAAIALATGHLPRPLGIAAVVMLGVASASSFVCADVCRAACAAIRDVAGGEGRETEIADAHRPDGAGSTEE